MEERDGTGIKLVFCRGSSSYMGFMQVTIGGDANALSVLIPKPVLWCLVNIMVTFGWSH